MKKIFILIIGLHLVLNSYLYSQYYNSINELQNTYIKNKVKLVNEYSIKNGKVIKTQKNINKNGLVECVINYDLSGQLLNKTVYDYSNKFQVIESILDNSGKKETETIFYLNPDGKVIKSISESEKSTFEYDDTEHTVYEFYVQISGGWYEFFYQYNDSGLLLEEVSKFGVTKYIYDNNLLIQTLYYDSFNNDALSFEGQYTYNDNTLKSKYKQISYYEGSEEIEEYLYEYEFYE